jgi:hypothetical protein
MVEGEVSHAHKIVLAMLSPVFKAKMFVLKLLDAGDGDVRFVAGQGYGHLKRACLFRPCVVLSYLTYKSPDVTYKFLPAMTYKAVCSTLGRREKK